MPRDQFLEEFGGCFSRKTKSFDQAVPTRSLPDVKRCVYPDGQDVFSAASIVIRHVDTAPTDEDLAGELAQLMIRNMEEKLPSRPLYFGKSSGANLLRATLDIMHEDTSIPHPDLSPNLFRGPPNGTGSVRSHYWRRLPVRLSPQY
jgi:hypothetical protein